MLQFWLETDKAAYLLRQYFFNNLHDRLSTRPFLCLIEKKWLAFQVIFLVLLSPLLRRSIGNSLSTSLGRGKVWVRPPKISLVGLHWTCRRRLHCYNSGLSSCNRHIMYIYFCSCFMQWSRVMSMECVMVRGLIIWNNWLDMENLWLAQAFNFSLFKDWHELGCRWYQVWECASHILELALSCRFCVIQTHLYSTWWSFWFLLLLWYRWTKTMLSCTRGSNKFFPFVV